MIKKVCTLLVSRFDGGIIQDKAIFFQDTLTAKASELIIKFEIKNVICSGPFHRASYFTTLLKKKFTNLNIIIDFRDRWTDGQVYGIENVPHSVFFKESAFQKYTCENADYVISTYQEILNELKLEYKHLPSDKFILFSHNYDLDDYPSISSLDIKSGAKEKIKFIYGGTINTAAFNDGFKPFFYALHKLKDSNNAVYNLIDVIIYGENYLLNKLVGKLNISDVVKIYPKTNEKEFYKNVSISDFLLVFLGNKWKDLFTTKSITYLPFRRPMLVVSEEGAVSKMVVKNKLGYHINPNDCHDNLVNLLQNYLSGSFEYDEHFDYTIYSYEKATNKLIQLLKFN